MSSTLFRQALTISLRLTPLWSSFAALHSADHITKKPLTSKARWAVVGYCVRIIGAQRRLHVRNMGGLNNPVLAQEEPKEYGSNEEYSQQADDCDKRPIHRRCHTNNIL